MAFRLKEKNLNRTIFMTKIKVIIDAWLYFWTIFQRMLNNCVLVLIKLLTWDFLYRNSVFLLLIDKSFLNHLDFSMLIALLTFLKFLALEIIFIKKKIENLTNIEKNFTIYQRSLSIFYFFFLLEVILARIFLR